MLKAINKIISLAIITVAFCVHTQAQNEISTPYSKYGYGLPSNVTSGAYDAMGKVGYAVQHPHLINFKNPASYVAFDSLSFIADAAFSIYSSTLKTADVTQQSTYARPAYITIGLPLTRHWRTSAGILPFSNLGYNIADSKVLPNNVTATYNYKGSGGLLQLYWGNAFKICKGLSIGVNISYLFGRLNYTKSAEFDGNYFFHSMVDNTTHVDGLYLSGGIQYFATIKGTHTIGLGVVYENSAFIKTRSNILTYNYSGTGTSASLNDTVYFNEDKGKMQTPQNLGGGFSYQYRDKWLVTADVTWQNWAHFYLNESNNGNLQDAITVSAGFQFVPNSASTNYLNKIRFRVGFRYCTGQIFVNEHTINDFSASIGLGFPLKMYNNNSSMGILFEYGQMGTLQNELLKENYFRFSLHFTLQEKWYQRVKLE